MKSFLFCGCGPLDAAVLREILECAGGRLVEHKPLLDVDPRLSRPGEKNRLYRRAPRTGILSLFLSWICQRSFCVMVMPSSWVGDFRSLAEQINQGNLTLEEAAQELAESSVHSGEDLARLVDRPRLPIFFALAKGDTAGRPTVAAASIKAIPPGMAKATGIPLALGTRLLLQGKVAAKGVIAPELAFDTAEFFHLLAPYCTFPVQLAASDLIEVTLAQG